MFKNLHLTERQLVHIQYVVECAVLFAVIGYVLFVWFG